MSQKIIDQVMKVASLGEKDIALIKSKLKLKIVRALEILSCEDSIVDFSAYVHKGVLRSYYNVDGDERIVNFFVKNQWIGNFKCEIFEPPSKITIQALEDSVLYVLTKEDSRELGNKIMHWDKITSLFYKNLYVEKATYLESVLTKTPEERYTNFLREKPNLASRIPQYYIAQYLGIKPESLSRIRKRITKKKIS